MDIEKIIGAYNRYERQGAAIGGLKKIETDHTVRFVAPDDHGNFVNYFDFGSSEADPIITAEIDFFRSLNKSFEWKVYDTDKPADIGQRLIKHGFAAGEPESFMVLDISALNGPLTESDEVSHKHKIVEVTTPQGIKDAVAVQEMVWNNEMEGLSTYLSGLKKVAPELITLYVVYVQGAPVASAWIIYAENSPFAGIWGGSTLKEHRKKGYYSALLNKRINDAKKRGVAYLTIDASEMSRPIVEKYGFQFVTKTTPYIYTFSQTS